MAAAAVAAAAAAAAAAYGEQNLAQPACLQDSLLQQCMLSDWDHPRDASCCPYLTCSGQGWSQKFCPFVNYG
jgi:hypothetical protein